MRAAAAEPQRGDRVLDNRRDTGAPVGLRIVLPFQGLAPLAIDCRPLGAECQVNGCSRSKVLP
jgi:hypothetical protein